MNLLILLGIFCLLLSASIFVIEAMRCRAGRGIIRCSRCGYQRTGETDGPCPECGLDQDGITVTTRGALPVNKAAMAWAIVALLVGGVIITMGLLPSSVMLRITPGHWLVSPGLDLGYPGSRDEVLGQLHQRTVDGTLSDKALFELAQIGLQQQAEADTWDPRYGDIVILALDRGLLDLQQRTNFLENALSVLVTPLPIGISSQLKETDQFHAGWDVRVRLERVGTPELGLAVPGIEPSLTLGPVRLLDHGNQLNGDKQTSTVESTERINGLQVDREVLALVPHELETVLMEFQVGLGNVQTFPFQLQLELPRSSQLEAYSTEWIRQESLRILDNLEFSLIDNGDSKRLSIKGSPTAIDALGLQGRLKLRMPGDPELITMPSLYDHAQQIINFSIEEDVDRQDDLIGAMLVLSPGWGELVSDQGTPIRLLTLDSIEIPLEDLIQVEPDPIYVIGDPSPDGIGRFYMGREISQVMGHLGAGWLERPSRVREERTDLVVRNLELEPDDVVADIGAGTGYFSFPIAETVKDGRVLAVDIQPEMLEFIEARKRQDKVDNVTGVLGKIDDPNLSPDSVDLAFMVDAYHEFSHPREMMLAIHRALRPGGRVVLLEYRAEDPDVPIKRLHKMTEAQVKLEMEAVGLTFIENRDVLPWQHMLFFEKQASP